MSLAVPGDSQDRPISAVQTYAVFSCQPGIVGLSWWRRLIMHFFRLTDHDWGASPSPRLLAFPWLLLVLILAAGTLVACASVEAGEEESAFRLRDRYLLVLDAQENSLRIRWTAPAEGMVSRYELFHSQDGTFSDPQEIAAKAVLAGSFGPGIKEADLILPEKDRVYTLYLIVTDPQGRTAAYLPKEVPTHRGTLYDSKIPVLDPGSPLAKDWWKTAVFYEIFVRSFQDSDGNGKGDFKGLTSRLDYLKDLGVGGLWLMPVQDSADRDHGYAVKDYFGLEKDYGSLTDFQELVREAHKRGIGIILDFVVNHAASAHPIFQNSSTGPLADYRRWFIWERDYPGRWDTRGASQDGWAESGTGYFWASFWGGMPDWNYRNPSVRNYLHDAFRFWLNQGLDGYRFDAVHHLIENGPLAVSHQKDNHPYYQQFRSILDQYSNRFMICENADPEYLNPQEFQSGFAFGLNTMIMDAARRGVAGPLVGQMKKFLDKAPAGSLFAPLLTNHDSFTGLRPMSALRDEAKAKNAAAIYLTIPGIPFIYYGEEIGLTNHPQLSGDPAIRIPMSWNPGRNAGFSTAEPYRPVSEGFQKYNVETELADPASILSFYRKMVALRNAHPALNSGAMEILGHDQPQNVAAYLRTAASERVLVLINLGKAPLKVALKPSDLLPAFPWSAVDLWSGVETRLDGPDTALEIVPGQPLLLSLR